MGVHSEVIGYFFRSPWNNVITTRREFSELRDNRTMVSSADENYSKSLENIFKNTNNNIIIMSLFMYEILVDIVRIIYNYMYGMHPSGIIHL